MLNRPPKWSKICETFPKWSMVSGGVEYLRKGIKMDGFAAPNSRVFPFSEWPFQEPKSKIPYMSIYIYMRYNKYIYINIYIYPLSPLSPYPLYHPCSTHYILYPPIIKRGWKVRTKAPWPWGFSSTPHLITGGYFM
jgi:hypothetical protein